MSSNLITGVLAAAAIIAVPALAICAPQTPITQPSDETSAAPGAQSAGINTSGVAMDASQMPPGQAHALQLGDNTLVANAPVADTPANRAKYGQPLSHAGKRTAPAGN